LEVLGRELGVDNLLQWLVSRDANLRWDDFRVLIGETGVGKYMARGRKPPSQTWRTFLMNHVKSMVSVDFFTVPTIRFKGNAGKEYLYSRYCA
jgi:hypothetical protein